MALEENDLIDKLALKIQKEHDPTRIEALAQELRRLLVKRKLERDNEGRPLVQIFNVVRATNSLYIPGKCWGSRSCSNNCCDGSQPSQQLLEQLREAPTFAGNIEAICGAHNVKDLY